MGFYDKDEAGRDGLPADVLPRPDTYYGFSKAALEALGSLFHFRYGMDVTCLRIGSCFKKPWDPRSLWTWMSLDDGARLFEACLATPEPGFRIVWGISRNTRRWWSLEAGEQIGYHPQDDSEVFAQEILAGVDEVVSASRKTLLSPMAKMLASSWVTTTTVAPRLSRSSRIRSSSRRELSGSSPADGSSKNKISGSSAMARASAARLRMPPLISEG